MKHRTCDLYTYITAFLKTCPFSYEKKWSKNVKKT